MISVLDYDLVWCYKLLSKLYSQNKNQASRINSSQNIVVCPDKILMEKKIYDIDKNIYNEVTRTQIADLVPETTLTNQSTCSSKNITHITGKSFPVEMIVHDNLERLINQGYWFIKQLAF